MGISVSLGSSVSFSDGLAFGLLIAVLAALVWTNPPQELRSPVTIFTGMLALATLGLVYVSFLQQRTLDQQARTMERTDETIRTGERAFVFVTNNNGGGWQRAE